MSAQCHFCNSVKFIRFFATVLFLLSVVRAAAATAGDGDLCDHSALDPDAAIPACTRLLESAGVEPYAAGFYNNRGVAKVRKGDFDSAIRDFDAALDKNPNFADAMKNRGIVHKVQGDFNGAIADFSRAIRVNEKSPDLFNLRGSALLDKEEYDRAIADFDQAIAFDRSYSKAFINRGQAQYFKRKFDRAIADFNEAVSLAPKEPLGYVNRAMARIDKADFKNAIADYDQAIRLEPKNSGFYTRRGEAWRLQGDLDRSLADHNLAIKMKASEEAYNNRALTYKDQGKLDKALADCDEAILLNPSFDLAYVNRGLVRRLMGNLGGSLRDLEKAISLAPRSPIALTFRGDTYREMGDLERSAKDFGEALSITPDFVAAYTGRGLTYEKRNDVARAKEDFQKAASLSADVDAGLAKPAKELAKTRLAAIAEIELKRTAEQAAQQAKEAQAIKEARATKEAQEAKEGEAKAKQEREAKEAKEARAQPANLTIEPVLPDPGNRVALVIGNSGYHEVASLPNPRRDAQAMEAAFRKIGFTTVISAYDVSRKDLIVALRRFQDLLDQADWAVIYYAGHGIEIGGQNYLIPVDAKLSIDTDVEDEAVSLERLLRGMEGSKKLKLRVVILDACRDNLFVKQMRRTLAMSRSVDRGLARVEPDLGTMVFYATRDGQTAEDGSGEHSPFTQALLNNIFKPRVEINMLFRRVREDVMNMTRKKQEPFYYGSLPATDFYFATK